MKKILLICFGLLIASKSYAQEPENASENNNSSEVKLNALYLVLGAFEGTYEYLLNEESGIGVSVFLPFDDEINENINYYISPYYRFYFGNKFASGFFLEGFGMLNSVNFNTYEYDGQDFIVQEQDRNTDFALGIGLGGKWITKRGLLGEINFGIGRNLFNDYEYDEDKIVGKFGITVGYRF